MARRPHDRNTFTHPKEEKRGKARGDGRMAENEDEGGRETHWQSRAEQSTLRERRQPGGMNEEADNAEERLGERKKRGGKRVAGCVCGRHYGH